MATDRDDEVARRYRAFAREEPPARLDAAILAASRRAVGARPGGVRRWGPPVSIAAVLVLATGVVLRMQSEQPGIETSAPATIAPPQPAPQPAPMPAPALTPPVEAAAPTPPAEARAKVNAPAERKRTAAPKPEPRQVAPMAAPPPPPPFEVASPSGTIAPAPATSAASAPAPAAAAGASASANLMRDARRDEAPAKRAQVPMATTLEKVAVPETPEAALDRIARLRAERRDGEADRALEAFRRDFPAYRITEAQWERVKPRTP